MKVSWIESFSTFSSFKWFRLKFSIKHFETKVKGSIDNINHVSFLTVRFWGLATSLFWLWSKILALLIWRRRYHRERGLIGRQKVRTGLAGFSSIPPVWYSFNILTKCVTIHPWFGCMEGSALNPVKVLKTFQFLYFWGLKLKITFFNT